MKVDDRTALLAIAKGEIDSFYVSDPDVAISASKSTDPNVRFVKSAFGQSPFIVWFNMRRKPMDDPRVRQALRYAIDTNAIAKDLFGGLAQPISSFLPPWIFGFSDNVMHYDFNPDKARQLLKDANVSPDWQPEMISQSILTISRRVTEAVASYWTDIGIKVKNSSIEQGIIIKRSADRDFDMYATYVSRVDPDQLTIRFWRSTGASNMSGYTGADDIIDKIAVETDLPTRAKLYRDLQDKTLARRPGGFYRRGLRTSPAQQARRWRAGAGLARTAQLVRCGCARRVKGNRYGGTGLGARWAARQSGRFSACPTKYRGLTQS